MDAVLVEKEDGMQKGYLKGKEKLSKPLLWISFPGAYRNCNVEKGGTVSATEEFKYILSATGVSKSWQR